MVEKASRESKVWEIVNRERRRKKVNKNIDMEEWKEHFMRLLGGGGGEGRVVKEDKSRVKGED